MAFIKYKNIVEFLLFMSIIFVFNGCDNVLLNPQGKIAKEESSLILISFIMMLIVVIPVIFMTIYFSLKYHCENVNQIYRPNWSDSKKIEVITWSIPIFIIFCLAFLTWNYSHKLEPSKPIPSLLKPVKIEVIALNWKWLFIYPEYHIATINEIAFPIHRPVVFHITSNSVMNSFFIPVLGSQIYAMPGMITKLNLIADAPGRYKGISSNYSGEGFSNMKFTAIAFSHHANFKKWINHAQQSSQSLNTMKQFLAISTPNKNYSVEYFSIANNDLFHQIINQFYVKNFFYKTYQLNKNVTENTY